MDRNVTSTSTGVVPTLPLVRHLSAWLTPGLARTPLTPNQITTLSALAGLGAAWFLMNMDHVAAAALLILCYALDNCDGEIARLKGLSSEFGMHYDTAMDWLVHSAFFVCLGIGVTAQTGEALWSWAGYIAAAGGTINYVLGYVFAAADKAADDAADGSADENNPQGWMEWGIFVFRELTRADFCFLVLLLALVDGLWLLLPAGAIGAQVYWLLLMVRSARRFHV